MLATPYIHVSFVHVVSEVPVMVKGPAHSWIRAFPSGCRQTLIWVPSFLIPCAGKHFFSQNGNTPPWGSHQMISGKVHNSKGISLLKPPCDPSSAALSATSCSNITSIVKNELAQPVKKKKNKNAG